MNMKSIIPSICVCLFFATNAFSQRTDAINMATTVFHLYPDSMVTKGSPRPANWNYEIGVTMMGIWGLWEKTGDSVYIKYIKKIVDHFVTADGAIRTYDLTDYNADHILTGRLVLRLYDAYKDPKYKKAADLLRQQIDWQPRNRSGGFWHKLKYPAQMWLDGLYMIEPFYAEYTNRFGNKDAYADIVHEFVLMEQQARDPKTGLLYHGWDESKQQFWADKQTGLSQSFWSRAMGWYHVALVEVLDVMDEHHPERKKLMDILNRLTIAITKVQDKSSGLWWQVTNKAGAEKNYLESSASAMFVYALAKSINKGYISSGYQAAAERGYAGLLKEFVVKDAEGYVHYTKAVAVGGLGGSPNRNGTYAYYLSEPIRNDDLKAIGPYMLAALEMEILQQGTLKK
jgi:unsaturated rhamnogalacturonyl hydrolase